MAAASSRAPSSSTRARNAGSRTASARTGALQDSDGSPRRLERLAATLLESWRRGASADSAHQHGRASRSHHHARPRRDDDRPVVHRPAIRHHAAHRPAAHRHPARRRARPGPAPAGGSVRGCAAAGGVVDCAKAGLRKQARLPTAAPARKPGQSESRAEPRENRMGRLGGAAVGRHGYRRLLPPGTSAGCTRLARPSNTGAGPQRTRPRIRTGPAPPKAVPQCGQRVVKAMALRGSYAFRPCRQTQPSRARQTDMAIHGA